MSLTIAGQRRVKARKAHNCFLCSAPIPVGTMHDTWTCIGDGVPRRLRVHDGCKSYAHDCIDGWTNGDGVEDNAVETDVWETIVDRTEEWVYVVNEDCVVEILATWPGLAGVVEAVRAGVRRENGEVKP